MQTEMVWLTQPGNLLTLAQVLAALVTAFATWALWRVTKVLAVETSALAKMTSNPFVVCYLRSGHSNPKAMNLTLENTGNATAFDIQLRVTPALPGPNSNGVVEKDATTFECSLLPPGKDLVIQAVLSTEASFYDTHNAILRRRDEHEQRDLRSVVFWLMVATMMAAVASALV